MGRTLKFLMAAGAFATCISWGVDQAPAVPISDNPYIELYQLRVSQAELNLRRQEALLLFANQRLDRGRRLIASKAISQEDLDNMVSDAAVAAADVDLSGKKIDEAKAYFRIVEALVKRGVQIPLCTYEME